jgi:RNA polymerase sigma factor (sigma-70 family)
MTAVSLAVPSRVRSEDDGYPEFYRRYDGPLTCYLRMAFRDADVEAVAQETLYRALTHWAEVRHMRNPWPWLAVTARNLARNNIRDEKATSAAGLRVFADDACTSDDVADQVDASDQLRRLAKAMDVLTPLQRQLLTVMVEEGLTGAQVARRLGMQPGAVRMHLCRMRSRLSERFVALGGQLAIGPVAVLGALARLVRRQGASVQRAAITAAGTGFAFSLAVVGVTMGGGVFGPATHLTDTTSIASTTNVADRHQVPAPAARAAGARGVTRTTAPAAVAAPADGYHIVVSGTPTNSGTVAEAGIRLTTPVGTVRADAPITMQAGGDKCPTLSLC